MKDERIPNPLSLFRCLGGIASEWSVRVSCACCLFMKVPLISVIVPVYRVEDYLHACMDSILGQTYSALEVICVNDGSPDRCGEILQEYAAADARVRVIEQPNRGLATARNAGLAAARGEYVGFVDSDDWIDPGMYAALVETMEATGAGLAVCGVLLEYEVAVTKHERASDLRYFSRRRIGVHALDAETVRDLDVCAWDKLYRRDLIERERLRFPDGYRYEDNVFFWAYAVRCRSVAILEERLYHYRRRPSSIISGMREGACSHGIEAVEVYEWIARDLGARGCFTKYAVPFFALLAGQLGLACASHPKEAEDRVMHLLKKYRFTQYCHLFGAEDAWVVQRLLPLCARPGWLSRWCSRLFRRHVSPGGVVRYKIFGLRFWKSKP